MAKADWSMAEWRDYYDKLCKKAYNNYQETGLSRYDREWLKYEKIVDAFDGYLEHKNETDDDRVRRMRNIDAFVKHNVYNDMYTRDEVLRLFDRIKGF